MNKKLELAEKYLKEAWQEFKRYEDTGEDLYLWEACEKGWAVVSQALKVINPNIKRHADFGKTAAELAKKYQIRDIIRCEAFGETLHRSGFYEHALDEGVVKEGLIAAEDLLKLIDNILNSKEEGERYIKEVI